MKKMRVWVVGRGIPNPHNRMLGSFELEQAQALERKQIDVVYICLNRSVRDYRHLGYIVKKIGAISIYSFSMPFGKILPISFIDRMYNKIFNILSRTIIKREGLPDIVHVHYPALMYYKTLEELKEKGVKIVATEHWTKVQEKAIGEFHLKNLIEYRRICDAFICVSSCLKQSVLELTRTKQPIAIVPNLVNPVFTIKSSDESVFRYIVSGRLVAKKQVDKIIQAFIHSFSKDDNVILDIAGGGNEYDKLKDMIISENREKQIHLLGTISREKMSAFMASANCLITYSKSETFCVPVIEAWMCGKPVIASSAIPVMIDHYDNRLGMLVDCDKLDSLKTALIEMRNKWAEYDSRWIAEYSNQHFSESAISQQLIDIYSNILQKHIINS